MLYYDSKLLEFHEAVSGARFHSAYFRPGGVHQDMPQNMEERLYKHFKVFPKFIDDLEELLTNNRILRQRSVDIGILSKNNLGKNSTQCDVSEYLSVKNAAKRVKQMKKPLKAFINAAGVASMNMAVTTDENTVQKQIQTNLVGTIYCCQLFAPIMLRQKKFLRK